MSVLLPAPFSPIKASTSPAWSVSETPESAITPGKRFTIPFIESSAVPEGTAVMAEAITQESLVALVATGGDAGSIFLHFLELRPKLGDVGLRDDVDARIDDLARRKLRLRGLAFGSELVHPLA